MCGLINSRVPAPGVWLLEHVVDSDRSPCEAYPVLAEAIGDHLATEWNRRPANRPRESRGRADRLLYSPPLNDLSRSLVALDQDPDQQRANCAICAAAYSSSTTVIPIRG